MAQNQSSCDSVKTKISTMTEVDRAHGKQAVEHQHRNFCLQHCYPPPPRDKSTGNSPSRSDTVDLPLGR